MDMYSKCIQMPSYMYVSMKAPHIVGENSNSCGISAHLLVENSRISGKVEKLPATCKLARQSYKSKALPKYYVSKY